MPYAILRFKKRKAGGRRLVNATKNERKKEAYKSNPDIDMEHSKENRRPATPTRKRLTA